MLSFGKISTLVVAGLLLSLFSGSISAQTVVNPSNMDQGEYPFSVSVSFVPKCLWFSVEGTGDTYSLMSQAHSSLHVKQAGKTLALTSVMPQAKDGVFSFGFCVDKDYVADSYFTFSFNGSYKLLLEEWVPAGDLFSANLKVDRRQLDQGENLSAIFSYRTNLPAVLAFSNTCTVCFHVYDSGGELVFLSPVDCGQAVVREKLEPGVEKHRQATIGTIVGEGGSRDSFPKGSLKPGKYVLKAFMRGYEAFALEDSVEFEVH